MAGEPRFYSRNHVDSESQIIANFGQPTTPRLFDRDLEGLKYSAGSGVTAATIEIRFKTGGADFSRRITSLGVWGTNIKDFIWSQWNGSSFVTVTSVSGLAVNFHLHEGFTPFTTTRIKLDVLTTQVPLQGVEIGELMALESIFNFGTDKGPDRLGFQPQPTAIITRMADEGLHITQLRWAGNRVERFRARLSFSLLEKADYDLLRDLVRRLPFNVYLEPVDRTSEVFLVTALAAPTPSAYQTVYKANGYSLEMELVEI